MDAEQIVRDVAEKVRQLVTEAEERAAQIVNDAEDEATRIRARAESEARKRLEEVRTAFEELQSRFGTSAPPPADAAPAAAAAIGDEVEPGPVTVPEPEPPATPEPGPATVPEPTPDPVPEPSPDPVPEPTPPPDEGTPPSAGSRPAPADDAVAARLVAMNMALEGVARDLIESKLAEDYTLENPGAIVDDVLAHAGR